MTLPPPPAPPYEPTTELVGRAWLALAVPYVQVGDRLPKPDQALRTVGFIRTVTAGGSIERDVPMRHPVITAECWVAPPENESPIEQWSAAGRLAQWVIDASHDPALMGRLVELTAFGAYKPARVHTVIAGPEPRRGPADPGRFARFDVDLQINWSAAA